MHRHVLRGRRYRIERFGGRTRPIDGRGRRQGGKARPKLRAIEPKLRLESPNKWAFLAEICISCRDECQSVTGSTNTNSIPFYFATVHAGEWE
ncbi:unnamed protein product [Protopolystoma xenopodis]|uniref:Uncharacterized protein n=1 Tax=Protopolystoma xenopodis TaxID=117903 RepID=A0A3S4ZZK3_9PLAT|nr:unnamed protein product [Protopolystoma xenopodis]